MTVESEFLEVSAKQMLQSLECIETCAAKLRPEQVWARELLAKLRNTVEEATARIRTLPPERLIDRVAVQGYDVTVLGAIYHVVEHFAGHAYQIILLTKQFTRKDLGFYAHLSGARPRKVSLP